MEKRIYLFHSTDEAEAHHPWSSLEVGGNQCGTGPKSVFGNDIVHMRTPYSMIGLQDKHHLRYRGTKVSGTIMPHYISTST